MIIQYQTRMDTADLQQNTDTLKPALAKQQNKIMGHFAKTIAIMIAIAKATIIGYQYMAPPQNVVLLPRQCVQKDVYNMPKKARQAIFSTNLLQTGRDVTSKHHIKKCTF